MYESHVTVEGMTDAEFIDICRELNAKPVVIEDDTASGVRQMMTAKFHKTNDLEQALEEMQDISSRFKGVIRRKVEKIIGKRDELPEHKYLEFHLKYKVLTADISNFVTSVQRMGGHTSKNTLKETGEDAYVFLFATARDLGTYQNLVDNLKHYQKINGIMECVVYDDNPNLDINWHGCGSCAFKSIPNFLEAS